MWGKLDSTCTRMKMDLYLKQYTKTNSKWIKDLNIWPETTNLLEENIDGKLLDTGLCNDFFGFDTKAKATKAKINKRYYITLKSFYTAKEATNKMKRQPTEWEKICANHISDQRLISKIYEELTTQQQNKTIWLKNE